MKCLILAAGYATRLYPLTENFPKPLLEVAGKSILDWLLDDIDTIEGVNEHIIISNHKYMEHFENWYVDESRQVGDTGLVKNTQSSVQGYHIMYFASSEPIWQYESQSAVLSERTSAMMDEAKAKWPMEVNYKNIVLGNVDLSAE